MLKNLGNIGGSGFFFRWKVKIKIQTPGLSMLLNRAKLSRSFKITSRLKDTTHPNLCTKIRGQKGRINNFKIA